MPLYKTGLPSELYLTDVIGILETRFWEPDFSSLQNDFGVTYNGLNCVSREVIWKGSNSYLFYNI